MQEEENKVYENENYFHMKEFPRHPCIYFWEGDTTHPQHASIFSDISAKHITNHKLNDLSFITICECIYVMHVLLLHIIFGE